MVRCAAGPWTKKSGDEVISSKHSRMMSTAMIFDDSSHMYCFSETDTAGGRR